MGKLKRSFPTYRQPGVVTFGTGSVKALIESDDLAETAIFLSGQEEVKNIVVESLHKHGHDLAEAYVMTRQFAEAKKETLYALEIAPAFERAQDLLLKIISAQPAGAGGAP